MPLIDKLSPNSRSLTEVSSPFYHPNLRGFMLKGMRQRQIRKGTTRLYTTHRATGTFSARVLFGKRWSLAANLALRQFAMDPAGGVC